MTPRQQLEADLAAARSATIAAEREHVDARDHATWNPSPSNFAREAGAASTLAAARERESEAQHAVLAADRANEPRPMPQAPALPLMHEAAALGANRMAQTAGLPKVRA